MFGPSVDMFGLLPCCWLDYSSFNWLGVSALYTYLIVFVMLLLVFLTEALFGFSRLLWAHFVVMVCTYWG